MVDGRRERRGEGWLREGGGGDGMGMKNVGGNGDVDYSSCAVPVVVVVGQMRQESHRKPEENKVLNKDSPNFGSLDEITMCNRFFSLFQLIL